MRRVSVSRPLILFGRLAEILVLQEQVRKPIVDGCRISLLRERLEVGAVPFACLAIIRELLVCFVWVLILGVIMRREIFQVRLQVGQYFRRLFRFEMSPVFGLQAVLGSELPLRLQYELGKSTLGESIHDAHAESRRGAVQRIKRYESFIRFRRIVVAQLVEIVLSKTGVNAVLIGAIPELGNILLQSLFVEFLLVERPSELIESQFIELGGGSQFDDARISALGIVVAPTREEVLAAPELHFVEVRGMRIGANQTLHCIDGLFGSAELVVRPRHLIENLVAVLVTGILVE